MSKARRIADIVLDEESVARRSPEVEHERAVALFDLAGDAVKEAAATVEATTPSAS